MDKFQEALMCKTLAPLRGESFEKGKTAEVGEVREWKGQKMRKTPTGWVPATESKQKSNQEETSTETKEQPKDLATLARSASDSALKAAAQGANEEVRIAAKRELERRKSEGSDVFEAPKTEETFTKTPKEKKTEETSKAKLDPTQSIKDMYMDDGDLVSVASCFHWLDELDWKKMNWTQYASAIHEINPDVDVTLAKNRYAKVMAAMADEGREKTLEIIKSIVKDQSELGDYDIIGEDNSSVPSKNEGSKTLISKEDIEGVQDWIGDDYTPEMIDSVYVQLEDLDIVNDLDLYEGGERRFGSPDAYAKEANKVINNILNTQLYIPELESKGLKEQGIRDILWGMVQHWSLNERSK